MSESKYEAIFDVHVDGTWVLRPSLKSYEDSVFTLYPFFTAINPFREAIRALQSLINAGFTGFHVADTLALGVKSKPALQCRPAKPAPVEREL